jgi:acyl-coenzyme A thioesterase 9
VQDVSCTHLFNAADHYPYRQRGTPMASSQACRGMSALIMSTIGVFSELTAMRVPTPWIQAFNQRKEIEDEQRSGVVATSSAASEQMAAKELNRSDSFWTQILPLARDPWLSDTYLNSSGHIR